MVGDHEPDGYKSIDVYGGRLKSKAFLLVVLVPSETMRKENPTNELGGLQWFIGGDDTTELRNEKEIIVHGLRGKQFTFTRSKGIIIDGKNRIFVLAFAGISKNDGSFRLMKRFFASFRALSGHARSSSHAPNKSLDASRGSVFRMKLL